MSSALDAVVNFFKENEWHFELDEGKQRVSSGIEGDNGSWRFVVSVLEEQELCFVLSIFPQKCQPKSRKSCAELLTRINYGFVMGCFELNMQTGSINFKAASPLLNGELRTETVASLVHFSVTVMDRFFPAIMSVIYAGTSPARALAMLERDRGKQCKSAKNQRPQLPRRFLNN